MVAMTTCVHTDQIWLGYVTFLGLPQLLADLVSPGHRLSHVIWVWYHLATGGHMWSHMVTMVTLVHIDQIWLG